MAVSLLWKWGLGGLYHIARRAIKFPFLAVRVHPNMQVPTTGSLTDLKLSYYAGEIGR